MINHKRVPLLCCWIRTWNLLSQMDNNSAFSKCGFKPLLSECLKGQLPRPELKMKRQRLFYCLFIPVVAFDWILLIFYGGSSGPPLGKYYSLGFLLHSNSTGILSLIPVICSLLFTDDNSSARNSIQCFDRPLTVFFFFLLRVTYHAEKGVPLWPFNWMTGWP